MCFADIMLNSNTLHHPWEVTEVKPPLFWLFRQSKDFYPDGGMSAYRTVLALVGS